MKSRNACVHVQRHHEGSMLKKMVGKNGDWVEKRDDVWVYDVSEFGARNGVLEFGYGWNLGFSEWFDPEMQFGQLLVIKTLGKAMLDLLSANEAMASNAVQAMEADHSSGAKTLDHITVTLDKRILYPTREILPEPN